MFAALTLSRLSLYQYGWYIHLTAFSQRCWQESIPIYEWRTFWECYRFEKNFKFHYNLRSSIFKQLGEGYRRLELDHILWLGFPLGPLRWLVGQSKYTTGLIPYKTWLMYANRWLHRSFYWCAMLSCWWLGRGETACGISDCGRMFLS